MNKELIQLLYAQSTDICVARGDSSAWVWECVFAELIVRECIKSLGPQMPLEDKLKLDEFRYGCVVGRELSVGLITEHFGLE